MHLRLQWSAAQAWARLGSLAWQKSWHARPACRACTLAAHPLSAARELRRSSLPSAACLELVVVRLRHLATPEAWPLAAFMPATPLLAHLALAFTSIGNEGARVVALPGCPQSLRLRRL